MGRSIGRFESAQRKSRCGEALPGRGAGVGSYTCGKGAFTATAPDRMLRLNALFTRTVGPPEVRGQHRQYRRAGASTSRHEPARAFETVEVSALAVAAFAGSRADFPNPDKGSVADDSGVKSHKE